MRAAADEINRLMGELVKANDALIYAVEKLGVDLQPNEPQKIPSIHDKN